MDSLWHHALLAVAVAGVAGTGWRVASLAAPRGAERVLAAATLAVAAIVVQALALGVFGLSKHALVLAGLALVVFGAVRFLTPLPALSARTEAATAWRGAGPAWRVTTGALLGLLAGWIAWQLAHPYVHYDGEIYHLPLAAIWAQDGHTASIVDVLEGVPVANYPVTNEVATSWAIGLSRSWVVASIWSPLACALLTLGAWTGLRRLRVAPGTTAAAIAAFVLLPVVGGLLGGPLTDVPTCAWLVTCGALCLAAHENPRLLAVALVAAGLSFGTKTTGSVLLALMLGASLWHARGQLRALALPLAGGLVLAILVGGLWALRNVVDHGSPLWPFVSGPFGDEIPPAFRGFDGSFLSERAWEGNTASYADLLSGGVLVLAGAIVVPLLVRTRAALIAGGVALLAMLTWANAPYTGITTDAQLAVGAVRYLLPALAASVLALAICSRDGGRATRRIVATILGLAILISWARTFRGLAFPEVPDVSTALAAAAVGGLAALAIARLPRLALHAAPLLALAAVIVGLTAAADGYVDRQTDAGAIDQPILRAALRDPGWRDGDFAIRMGPATAALLSGDELRHRVRLLESTASCAEVRDRRGWVIVVTVEASVEADRLRRCLAGERPLVRHQNFTIYAR